jgi:hypothetical protein
MDGASILTFITTGLQALQTIHFILSSISDGPARLSDLRDALCDLQQLLEQIRDDPTLSSAIDKRGEAMEKSVLRCNNYIQCLQEKVIKLSLSPGDGLHEKFKKRLKLTLSEKEILYMLDSISRHMASLTLQSNIRHTSSLAEIVDFGFGGKTGHVFCLLVCNPSFVILSLWKVLGNLTSCI